MTNLTTIIMAAGKGTRILVLSFQGEYFPPNRALLHPDRPGLTPDRHRD